MKIPVQIILVVTLSGFAFAKHGQAQGVLQRKVSLSLHEIPFEKALKALESASKVKFVYSSNHIRVNEKVSVDADMKPLGNVLNELLTPLRITYSIQDNNEYIVLASGNEADGHRATTDSHDASKENNSQTITMTGKVNDFRGAHLPGVNVLVKGTAIGTTTDIHGNFTIEFVGKRATLVFSFIGYATREVDVADQTAVNVVLEEELTSLHEVVITALGIKRSEKSITYATQQISGEELTRAKTDNFMNTLNGKIPGVTIFPSASGVGGSSKVILRGNRSFSQSNQPLYVVDGVPVTNSSNSNGQPNSPFAGPVDGGDGISNLNPDDIETITILKGASASALYGSQAANGAILITTKRGKEGMMQVNFNSSFLVSTIAYKPEFQNHYGRANATSKDSWGPRITGDPANNNVERFFETGFNWTNSINLSGGSDVAQTYFSYANTLAKGVTPGNDLGRNNFKLQQTAKFLQKKLIVDANINYVFQRVDNTPVLGLYSNPLTGLYLFPRDEEIAPYKDHYVLDNNTGYARQNWITNEDIQQNPWWIVHRNPNYSIRRRLLIAGNVRYEFNDWLSLQLRGNLDRNDDTYEQDLFSGTQATLSKPNGQFVLNTQTLVQKYGDALLIVKMPLKSDFEVDGIIGASITDGKTIGTALGPGLGLKEPDLFVAQNIDGGGTINFAVSYPENHNQLQSVFGSVNVSFKEWLSMNITGRNDWSSNLAFTPNVSYFYPSAGISVSLTEALKLPQTINYLKVRGNYAQVGNTVPQYVTNPVNYQDNTGSVVLSTVAPFGTLKPERTKTYEIGTDARFFNRLSLTLNYYRSNTYNQFIKVTPSVATGYSVGYVNAGNVQNVGLEFSASYTVLNSGQLKWITGINGATNVNTVVDVNRANGIDKFILTTNDNTSYQSVLVRGGSYGDIYGVTARRDSKGRIIVNPDGTPQVNNGFHYIGNPNSKLALGWTNSMIYGNFDLSFLIDGKFGGQVFSMTNSMMDQYGVSKETGLARDRGGVKVNAVNEDGQPVTMVDAQKWYTSIGGRQGISELYVYSATVVRVREAAVGYTAPFRKSIFKSLRVSITGRNLFYLYKKAPYDPELIMSTGNGLSGVDIFNQPATRNFGLVLNATL